MRKIIFVALLFMVTNQSFSQAAATKEHIKTLLELTGAGKIGVQMMENVAETYKKSMPDVPGDFWDEFLKEARPEILIDLIVPIYSKHFTDEEIVNLIAFYQTPLGKKVVEKLPLISQESYVVGSEWGKNISEQVVKKLTEKGFIKNN